MTIPVRKKFYICSDVSHTHTHTLLHTNALHTDAFTHRCLLHRDVSETLWHNKAGRKHVPVLLCTTKLAQNTFQYCFVLQGMRKILPSTILYYKACANHFPVLLCTTKLSHTASQYYFVLQSFHRPLPSTTLCAKYFPGLLCVTKLAPVLLCKTNKELPSTTLHRKACAKYFPVLLCTAKPAPRASQYYFVLPRFAILLCATKLAEGTFQYCYFVPQSFCKALPTTTSYYKPCAKYFPIVLHTTKLAENAYQSASYHEACRKCFPVLIRTAKLAESTSQYSRALTSLQKVRPSTTSHCKACTGGARGWEGITSYYKARTKHFPEVLVFTTKFAQSTSLCYFMLQSLHQVLPRTSSSHKVPRSLQKVLPSATLYYKACRKNVPEQLRAAKLAQGSRGGERGREGNQYYFVLVLQSLGKALPSTTCTTELAKNISQY